MLGQNSKLIYLNPDADAAGADPGRWRAAVIAGLAVLATALVGIELTRNAENVASVWLASGVTIGLMLRWQAQQVQTFALSIIMILVANLAYGDPVTVAVGLTVANALGVIAVLVGLRSIGWRNSDIDTGHGILRFAVFAMGVGPLVGCAIGALVINQTYGAPFIPVAERWFLSDMVGSFIIAPAVISRWAWSRLRSRMSELLLWLAVLACIGAAATQTSAQLVLFAVAPVMIVLATRLGIAAVGIAGALVAIAISWMTIHGVGSISHAVGGDVGQAIIWSQFFLVLSIGGGQLVAVLMEERRRTEVELLRYRTTIENAPEGILLSDPEGNFLLSNQKFMDILGFTEESYKANQKLGRPQYHGENAAIIARIAKGETLTGLPFNRVFEDGRRIEAELNGVPIVDDGVFIGAAISLRDVSEERKLKDLAESRTRELEAFLDAAAEGVIGTGPDGRITVWNRAAEVIYGIGAEEALGMHAVDLPGGEPAPVRRDRQRRLAQGEKFRNLQSVRRARDGTEREVEISINPIFDRDGKYAGSAGSLRDLSEIRRAEARILESQQQLVNAIKAITDAIAIYDANERLVHFNENYARIAFGSENLQPGCAWEQLLRNGLKSGVATMGDEAIDVDAWINTRRSSRTSGAEPFLLSLPNDVWLLGRDYPMEDGGFICIRQDVSELKKREAELARSNKDLEQFAFIASHDLREPLRKIQSFGEILQEDYSEALPDEAKTFLGFMTNGADRMEVLIDDLLEFSRAGRSSEALAVVDLSAVVAETLDNLMISMKESGAIVNVAPLPHAMGRHGDLVRIFQNLIGNAIKYRDPGREIVIDIRDDGDISDQVVVSISDNGRGIDPAHAELVFEPFKRLTRTEKISGTGMGLAIVRKLAVAQGGQVWLDTRSDKTAGPGAHFRLKLLRA